MKRIGKTTVIVIYLIYSAIMSLSTQENSWGDSRTADYRQSINTAPISNGGMALDGNSETAWELVNGSTSGWLEVSWSAPCSIHEIIIDAKVPASTVLQLSVLKQNHWLPIPTGKLVGPIDGSTSVLFPNTLGTTDRLLVFVEGSNADGIRIRGLSMNERTSSKPYVRIAPLSYTFNQNEYINLKAGRLWDGISDATWFEPLWNFPREIFHTDGANATSKIFPSYFGNPPKSPEIVWEFDSFYQIETLKVYLLTGHGSVQFEFWDGTNWTQPRSCGSETGNHDAGWLRLDLDQPFETNRIRITFPGGWEQARGIGELEVWGLGYPALEMRSLVMPPAGSDGTRLFTIEGTEQHEWILEIIRGELTTHPMMGDWNGTEFTAEPLTWVNTNTIYQIPVDVEWLRDGTQFLRLNESQTVRNVNLLEADRDGRINLGWPYNDGITEGTEPTPDVPVPAFTTRTWELGADYELENIRVFSRAGVSFTVFTGTTEKQKRRERVKWSPVTWTDDGNGFREARLRGILADRIRIESSERLVIDEIEMTGTRLGDTKIGMERWWPPRNGDGNFIIGWTCDSSVHPMIDGSSTRQAKHIFWMPVDQVHRDGKRYVTIEGHKGNVHFREKISMKRMDDIPGTFDQGEEFLITAEETLIVSGTVEKNRYRIFVDGNEVPVMRGKYETIKMLRSGYQQISIEIRDRHDDISLVTWNKEIYRTIGTPLLISDLPYGDIKTGEDTLLLAGRVGNGIGLSLTVDEQSRPLEANQFSFSVALEDGPHTFNIILTDSLGTTSQYYLHVTRCSAAPSITIEQPQPGQYVTHSGVELIVSTNSETGLWWKINDEEWEYDAEQTHRITYNLPDGDHHFEITARDESGNTSETKLIDFIVDTLPPENFTIHSGTTDWTTNVTPIISFETKDITSGMDHYEISFDGIKWQPVVSPYMLPVLADGIHTAYVKAFDKAGNATIETIIFRIDTAPPFTFEASVNTEGWSSNNRPTLGFRTTDETSGVLRYEVKLDDKDWAVQQSPYQFPVLADGVHTITVRALDHAGNITTAETLTVYIDVTAPEDFSITVNVDGWSPNNTPILTFQTIDGMSGVERYEMKFDDTVWTIQESPYQMPPLVDGTHSVIVRAVDSAGNTTSTPVQSLSIDTTSPVSVQNFRMIPGTNRMETIWTTEDTDIVVYHVVRTEENKVPMSFDTTETTIYDEDLAPGIVLQYKIQPQDRAGNLGEWTTATASIAGLAVKFISNEDPEPVVVEYDKIKIAVPPSSLPPEVKAVLIDEIGSAELEEKTGNPIIGPIYSFTSLQEDESEKLIQTSHTEFENEVLVILEYDESLLPNGFPESDLSVYYYDTLWSRWFRVEKSAIDIEQNRIIFLTNHFTEFSVQPTLIGDLKPQELKDAGHSPFKSESQTGDVTVSPQGGTMMTEVTEFVLKGKNGFTYPVKRIYDSQTARVDSPSVNLSMTLGFSFSIDLPAQIARQLISAGVNLAVSPVLSKLTEMFKKNGDFPLALGIGWRLNFPYVSATDTSVMVRLPDGGYYPINQMELQGEAPVVSGVRSLTLENHCGEDFTFKVHQVRGDVTSAINGLIGVGQSKIVDAIQKTSTDPKNYLSISLLASFIPGWLTVASELITKDGTAYVFDSLGRVESITDPSGTNVIEFVYNGFILEKIIDPLGNETYFEYNDGNLSGVFLRPCITKITTPGAEGTNRICSYEYDTKDVLNQAFMTLPAMITAWDVGGRKTSYGIDERFLFSGGGSAKINFLAILLDVVGVGFVNQLCGISSLTISGRISLEWPRLIEMIEAPGMGITEITYFDQDLSNFDVRPADFFLGIEWLPTALQLSYDFLFRIVTASVTARNGNLVATTHYDYRFTPRKSQWIVDKTIIDDGLTETTQEYDIYYKKYNRYVSFDDAALAALKQGLFTEESNIEEEFLPVNVITTSVNKTTGMVYETNKTIWDTTHNRPLTEIITRGDSYVNDTAYEYDDWGNITETIATRTTPQGTTTQQVRSWYFGTSSQKPSGFPAGLPVTPVQKISGTKSLLLGNVTVASRPVTYFGSTQDIVYRSFSYDTGGRIVWQGVWKDDHWAASTTTYYPVTADHDRLSGMVQEIASPTGQKTHYDYDFTSLQNNYLWTETKRLPNVVAPSGERSDIVEQSAYDMGTNWIQMIKSAEGFVTEMRYDALGRLTSLVKPGAEAVAQVGVFSVARSHAPWDRIVYNDSARTSTLYRDTATGMAYSPDGTLGPAEFYEYDICGNLKKISKYERSTGTVYTSVTLLGYDAYDRVVSMTDPLGRITSYTYDFLSRPIRIGNPDGTEQRFTHDDVDGIRETTNERGVVTREFLSWNGEPEISIADSGGLNLTSRRYYDGLDREVATVDPLGQTTLTDYSVFGTPGRIRHQSVAVYQSPDNLPNEVPSVITTIVTPEERTTYDDEGRPVTIRTGIEGNWRTTTTTYDGAGRTIKENIDGREIWTWYNGSGKPIKQSDAEQTAFIKEGQTNIKYAFFTYTSRNQVATRIDPSGAVTFYEYDRDDKMIMMREPRGFTIWYVYDDLNRLVKADLPPVTGQDRSTTLFSYDLRGNLLSKTDPDGKVTRYTYNKLNLKTSQTVSGNDGKQLINAWGYDSVGNINKEIIVSNLNSSAPESSAGLVTVNEYDALNRVILVNMPDGQLTKNKYDKLGRVIEVRNASDNVTEYEYNSLNKLIKSKEPLYKITTYAYNVWGDATSTTMEGSYSGNQVWIRGYNHHSQTSWELNNAGQSWRYEYDLRGLPTESTDPNGTLITTIYSSTGLPTEQIYENGNTKQTKAWSYDEAGSLKSATDDDVVTSINHNSGTYVADPFDLITSLTTNLGSRSVSWSATYDKGMRPLSLMYPDNQTVRYAYNSLGQLTTIPGFASEGIYNFMGVLENLNAQNGTGRKKTWDIDKGTLKDYQWTGMEKAARSLTWDKRGNITSIIKEGNAGTYVYDALNRLVYADEDWPIEKTTKNSQDTHYGVRERDIAGRKNLDYSQPSTSIKLDYHASSVGIDLGSEQTINRVRLMAMGARVDIRTAELYISKKGTDNTWEKVSVLLIPEQLGTTLQLSQPVNSRFVKVHSVWDERDIANQPIDHSTIHGTPAELIEVWTTVNGQITSWSYDALGNRIDEHLYRGSDSTISYSYYPNSNRIKTRGEWKFNYDANGNLTTRGTSGTWNTADRRYIWDTAAGELWQYMYDLKNRLVAVQHGAAGSTSLKLIAAYTYDSRDLRVAVVKNGKTTYYQYDWNDDLIWVETEAMSTKYIRALEDVWAEVRMTDGGSATYYHHTDHLGTTEMITNDDGVIVWNGNYEVFGAVVRSNGDTDFTPSYTGKQLDTDTGLYYFNARWYEPELGRFINEDPARDDVNWYIYCGNNPLIFKDPTGLRKNSWTQYLHYSKGVFKDNVFMPFPTRASLNYHLLIHDTPPWPPNFDPPHEHYPQGFRFTQAKDSKQPSNSISSWATQDILTSEKQIRNQLAILPAFKAQIDELATIEEIHPDGAKLPTGPVGIQIDYTVKPHKLYPGGGTQVEITGENKAKFKEVTPRRPIKKP